MKHALALRVVRAAAAWSRHPWLGDAMLADYDEAARDGKGLRFAMGCAWASLRVMPSCRPGLSRFAGVVLALGMAAPFAVFELGCARHGISFVLTGREHYYAYLMSGNAAQQARGEAYRLAAPLFTLLLLAIGASQTALAWLAWRRRWHAALQVTLCTMLAGVFMAAIVLTLRLGAHALMLYLGIPAMQWCIVRWMHLPAES